MNKLLIFLLLIVGCGGSELIEPPEVAETEPSPAPEPDPGPTPKIDIHFNVPKKCKRIHIIELTDGSIDIYCDVPKFNRWKYRRKHKRMICNED